MSNTMGPPPLPGRTGSRKPILSFAIGGFLLLLIGVPLGWYVAGRARDRNAVRRLEADIRRKGEPLTLKELAATYQPVPDEQNAAVVLLNLWEKEDPVFWRAFRDNVRPLPTPAKPSYDPDLPFLGKNWRRFKSGQKPTPASINAAEALLKTRQEHLDAIRLALERPRCRFPINIEDGLDTLLPHLPQLKTEAQTLRIAAVLAAERGDRDAAISALEELVRLSGTLVAEPLTVSQLVRLACLQLAISGTEDLLSRQRLTVAEIDRVEQILKSMDGRKTLHQSLLCERATALSLLDLPEASLTRAAESDSEPRDPTQYAANYRRGMKFLNALGLTLADRRLILETMGKVIQFAEEDPPDALRDTTQLANTLDSKMCGFPPKIFSRLILSAEDRLLGRFISLEARKRAALVAVALERYRSGPAGNLPEKLDSLVPQFLEAVPKDPFDGQPLRYRRTDAGYVVYSVGPDLRDDGGNRTRSNSARDLDEIFAVERIR